MTQRDSRQIATEEADADLKKPIRHLLIDVHHEALQPRTEGQNILHSTKRMTSMMARVAIEHERVGRRLVWLNIILAVLTALLVCDIFRHK